MSDESEILTYEMFGVAARELAETIAADNLRPDAVADSGGTLKMVVEPLRAHGSEVRTVCLYSTPSTVEEPSYVWKKSTKWIMFPWSSQGPVAYPQVSHQWPAHSSN